MTREERDDAISRQWLIECVNEGWIKFDTEKDKNIFIHLIRDIAPSVTPQILEQEQAILGKIRAKIEQMPSELTADGRRMIRRESVFRIIGQV